MKKRKDILVAFDGSPPAMRALEFAIDFAKATKATVHVMNAQLPRETYASIRGLISETQYRQKAREQGRQVLGAAERRLKARKVNFESEVGFGECASAIVRSARRRKCAAIAMGTQGAGALRGAVLGSIAWRVIHLAEMPVVLVR